MQEFEKQSLIKYRMDRSHEASEDARISIENDRLFNARNRIYYALFYAVSALSAANDFSTSKHIQLIGWFNKNFIHTGIFPVSMGKFYKRSYENRQESDYDDFIVIEKNEVIDDFHEIENFINAIESKLNGK